VNHQFPFGLFIGLGAGAGFGVLVVLAGGVCGCYLVLGEFCVAGEGGLRFGGWDGLEKGSFLV